MYKKMDWADHAPLFLLVGAVCLVLVSIAASQLLLFAAIVAVLYNRRFRRMLFTLRPPVLLPLASFLAWTIVTALAAHDVARGLLEIRKFFLYSILVLVPLVVQGVSMPRLFRVLFLTSLASASAGLVQFSLNPSLDLHHRISGFMSHWMTYSGLLMLVLVALSAYVVGLRRHAEWWVFGVAAFLIAGMYLSETRNAWLGSVSGLATVFLLRRPRAIALMIAFLTALFIASPASVKQRLRSGWDLSDAETHMRVELLRTSFRIIRDHPWIGLGPKNVSREALRYRSEPGFEDSLYVHMHNNFLQIAAERGLPGLILWIWLMIRLALDAVKVFSSARIFEREHRDDRAEAPLLVSTAALGGLAALLVAGMFEYNFGDSEVLTLFLFIVALPYQFLRNGDVPPVHFLGPHTYL